jgi:hypothetical protein
MKQHLSRRRLLRSSAVAGILGEKTGAFTPVVSDDLAMYAPENLRRFDAIVLNNASGAWITPTAADLAKPALKKHGANAEEVEKVLRKSFLDFLEDGGGVVCLHFAIAANRHWPAFQELLVQFKDVFLRRLEP